MKKFIKFLKLLIPPIFLKVIVNNKTVPVRTFKTYDEAIDFCDSYSNQDLVKVIAAKGLIFKNKIQTEKVDFTNYDHSQLLKLLLINTSYENVDKEICILDFGGGAGHHYFISRKIISNDIKLKWIVFETPELVEECKILGIENEELSFIGSFDQKVFENTKFDIIYSNYSLVYTPSPIDYLENLLKLDFAKFYITNTALNEKENISVVGIQKSDLSTNGVGRQIPDTLKIKNRDIQYPFTVIGKEDFEKLIKKYTDIVFSIREQKEAYVTEKGIFNLYGYLLIKKNS